MLRAVVAATVALAIGLSGCFEERHMASTHFEDPGAFRAAIAAGADVDKADGPGLSLAAADLDEAWGEGHYLLTKLQWNVILKGTYDPAASTPENYTTITITLDADSMHVGQGHWRESIRAPIHRFLENTTRLSADERASVADRFVAVACSQEGLGLMMGGCSLDDLGLAAEDFDFAPVWTRIGGLAQATDGWDDGYTLANDEPVYASPVGTWLFMFAYDVAELGERWFDGAAARVSPTDIVSFHWVTDERQGDAAAYDELVRTLRGTGIDVPPPGNLTWVHGMTDD